MSHPSSSSTLPSDQLVRRGRRGMSLSSPWVAVTRGVHRRIGSPDPWFATLAAWSEVLPPEGRWTGLTAARLHQWWLPPIPQRVPLFAAVVSGLRVDPPLQVIAWCARHLGLLDLRCLVIGALAHASCTTTGLEALARSSVRGAPRLRAAMGQELWSEAESIWEIILAELHGCVGIHVEPQHEVLDSSGTFIARADLWLVGTRRIHEYDGSHHRDPIQHRLDLQRDRRLGLVGWSRRAYTSNDLLTQAVHVLADADHALGRRHQPDRIRPWYALLRDSLFTAAGRSAFLSRLR